MADQLANLRRIKSVQTRMIALAEMRLASAERTCRDLADDKQRLDAYVVHGESPSSKLLEAAVRSLRNVDSGLAAATSERDAQRDHLAGLHRRDSALDAATQRAEVVARRAEEARDLADVVEAWFASRAGTAT